MTRWNDPARGREQDGGSRRFLRWSGAFSRLTIVLLTLALLGSGFGALYAARVVAAPNPIVAENSRAGTTAWQSPHLASYTRTMELLDTQKTAYNAARKAAPADSGGPRLQSSQWTRTKAIEGYAGRTSVNQGEPITLHISSSFPSYDVNIYRVGWYGGNGARLQLSVRGLTGVTYPVPAPDANGMVDAGWPVAYTVQTDATWTSGVYLAWLSQAGSTNLTSYIFFVVRNDGAAADILYPIPTTTYQAYNAWGGKSLYDYNSAGGRAAMVSYNRPYDQNDGSGLFFPGDYHMVRWLEKEGYNVTYATSEDIEAKPNLMDGRKVFLSNFHDEYWSSTMRQHLTAWRDGGKDLAFFDSNNIYWQIRYAPSADGVPNRVIICYKDRALDPMSGSATPELTTVRFRDAPVNQPENALLGTMFDNVIGYGEHTPWVVSDASHWIYAGTGVQNGDSIPYLIGYEFDRLWMNGFAPPNLEVIATSPVSFPQIGINSVHHAVIYTAQSGAMVFNAGTNYWPYLLFGNWNWPGDARVGQMTRNILNRMIQGSGTPGPTATPSYTPSPTRTMVPTTTPLPGRQGLYRAINLAGDPAVIDGYSWEGSTAPNYTTNGTPQCNSWTSLDPVTDPVRTAMIRCAVQHWAHSLAISNVPSGAYDVYAYMWQSWNDPNPARISVAVEGQPLGSWTPGAAGSWVRLGPWRGTVADGTLNLTTSGGTANLSGIEIWNVDSAGVPSPTATSIPTATRTPTATPSGASTPSVTPTAMATLEPGSGTFFRAINLNGPAQTVDVNSWEGEAGAANFSSNGTAMANQWLRLAPTTDAARTAMLRTWRQHWAFDLGVGGMPNGVYQAYIYTVQDWDNPSRPTISLSLEGQVVGTYVPGGSGSWSRLGPYTVTVSDGTLNLRTSGGTTNIAAVEIWAATSAGATPTSTSTLPFTPTATATATSTPAPAVTATATSTPAPAVTATATATSTPAPAVTATATSTPAPAVTATATVVPPAGNVTFVRAINLNGPAQTVDGSSWEGEAGAANFSSNGTAMANQWLRLAPTTDAERTAMLRTWRQHWAFDLRVSSLPTGSYQVYIYTVQDWDNPNRPTVSINLEGQVVGSHTVGGKGSWSRLGPYTVTVSDGTLNLRTSGGTINIAGVELWRVDP
jgi:hypothetical protein